jgi:nitrate/nitrite transporter NarK
VESWVKDWTLSAAAAALLALAIGLLFHWVYPTVEPSAELAGLFCFVGLLLRLLGGKLAAVLRRSRVADKPEARS